MTEVAGSDGRATVQKVYDVVGELRAELSAKIDYLAAKVDTVVVSHEHRITTVETVQAGHDIQLVDHEGRLGMLEKAHDRALGHIGAFKILGGVIGGAATIILGDVILRAFGG